MGPTTCRTLRKDRRRPTVLRLLAVDLPPLAASLCGLTKASSARMLAFSKPSHREDAGRRRRSTYSPRNACSNASDSMKSRSAAAPPGVDGSKAGLSPCRPASRARVASAAAVATSQPP